jgi:MazG family protein
VPSPGPHLDRLVSVFERLRAEGGCAWDRERTLEDLGRYLREECDEVVAAIGEAESGAAAPAALREECGDLLANLVFTVQVARERGWFDMEEVARGACEKIVRRHPHVFGGEEARDSRESLAHWDRIKAEEKKERPAEKPSFADVPANLPPIRRAERLQRIAAKSGFDWPDAAGIIAKIREEAAEVEALLGAGRKAQLAEEIGDLYFSVANLSRFLGIDGEASLALANAKFVARYLAMEELALRDGHRIEELSLDEMDRYWEEAKRRV